MIIALILIVLSSSTVFASDSSEYLAGIVYGPKAAFRIDAPERWILDNKAGLPMGIHCVLYPVGGSWAHSPVVMYAAIADTSRRDINRFIDYAVAEFKAEDPDFKHHELKRGKVNTCDYIVMDYSNGAYQNFERVAYFQLENAVAYVVLTSRTESDFRQKADALLELIETFQPMPEYINYSPGEEP